MALTVAPVSMQFYLIASADPIWFTNNKVPLGVFRPKILHKTSFIELIVKYREVTAELVRDVPSSSLIFLVGTAQSLSTLSDLNRRHVLGTRLGDLGKPETSPELTKESEYKQTYFRNQRRARTANNKSVTNEHERKLD